MQQRTSFSSFVGVKDNPLRIRASFFGEVSLILSFLVAFPKAAPRAIIFL